MNKRHQSILYQLSRNARATTKEIGREARLSQQAASYQIRSLSSKKWVHFYRTIIDPAKFGLVKVVVFYNLSQYGKDNLQKAIAELSRDPFITFLQELTLGADILAEYTVPNLSLFNKRHRNHLSNKHLNLHSEDIFVVIVRRLNEKRYLQPRMRAEQCILSGDRELVSLTDFQLRVLKVLHAEPRIPLSSIALDLNVDPKTVLRAKQILESNKVIQKYTVVLNYRDTGIIRRYLLIKLDSHGQDQMERFIEYSKHDKNMVEVTKIIGKYDLIVAVEQLSPDAAIINNLRKEFAIVNYRILECGEIHKSTSIPPTIFDGV